MYTIKDLNQLPENPGVYLMHNHIGEIIYVGKAINLRKRVKQYFQKSKKQTLKTQKLVTHIEYIETIIVGSELEALILECNLIKKHRPKYNILLKDDKNYPWICVSLKETYPTIYMARNFKDDGNKYFGPFTSGYAVQKTIESILNVYPLQRCHRHLQYGKKVGRPCLYYHMGQCNAPCTGKIVPKDYFKDVEQVLDILSGRDKRLKEQLKVEMKEAAKKLAFEKAAKLRDQIKGIEHIVTKQKIIQTNQQDSDVIAIARDNDLACVQVFNIREGKLIGQNHVFLEGIRDEKTETIMTNFIKQYYNQKAFIPKEIILSSEIESQEKPVIEKWLSQMRKAKVTLTLPIQGQKSKMIKMVYDNACLVLSQKQLLKNRKTQKKITQLDALQELLALEDIPKRIEAYDISNISGTNNVGGMVVFENGKPQKKAYRRFKIKSVTGQNDYGSMQEMIFRRMERGIAEKTKDTTKGNFLPFPEVMCIDGGKTHVNAVSSVLSMYKEIDIKVCGLVKNDQHQIRGVVYKEEEYPLKPGTPLTKLLYDISEEVHRFALGYHQNLRKKTMLETQLTSIKGVGPKRRALLLSRFGTLEKIAQANVEELEQQEGINHNTAQAVYDYFKRKA